MLIKQTTIVIDSEDYTNKMLDNDEKVTNKKNLLAAIN